MDTGHVSGTESDQGSLFAQEEGRYPRHVLSFGLGADSSAILLRWLNDPTSRDFELDDLLVITAMTGDEFDSTKTAVDRYVLPALARAGVRYVQVGRNQLNTDKAGSGVAVFSDTTAPSRLFIEGDYSLSDEMLAAGTLPQRGGARKCSARSKGGPLDAVIAKLTGGQPFTHYIGFEINETRRADRDKTYDSPTRHGAYPLIEWGWTRDDVLTYLRTVTGDDVDWPKSCCTYCPFALATRAGLAATIERYRAEPAAAVKALLLEHVALALNPRQQLMERGRLFDAITNAGLVEVLAAHHNDLATRPHTLYEVRRVARPRSDGGAPLVARSVRPLRTGTAAELADELQTMPGTVVDGEDGITRVVWRERATEAPWAEGYYVVCPAVVGAKQRPGFETLWSSVAGDGALFAA